MSIKRICEINVASHVQLLVQNSVHEPQTKLLLSFPNKIRFPLPAGSQRLLNEFKHGGSPVGSRATEQGSLYNFMEAEKLTAVRTRQEQGT